MQMCCSITFVFFKANIGQDEDFKVAREKAESLGASKVSDGDVGMQIH